MLGLAMVAWAAGLVPLGLQASTDPPVRPREWRIQELSWVRLVPAEPGVGAGNAHPAMVWPEALRRALGSVGAVFKGRTETLFSNEELEDLVGPMAAALAAAGPGQDVEVLSTVRRHGNFQSTPYGITTRLFVNEAGLNLIVHDTRLDFYHAYRATKVLPAFQYGSRRAAGPAALASATGRALRQDWLVFSLEPAPLAAPAPATAVAPPVVAAPLPAPASRRDERFFEEQEQRLRALQRLREQDLITEEEYQRKRREILQIL